MRKFYFHKIAIIISLCALSAYTFDDNGGEREVEEVIASMADDTAFFYLPDEEQAAVGSSHISALKKAAVLFLPDELKKTAEKQNPGDFLSIKDLISMPPEKIPNTKWNLFRLQAYEIASQTKTQYPNLGCTEFQLYDWMMKTFRLESGFSAKAQTKLGSASGLFQIIKSNRKKLNFPDNWKSLSEIEQLRWYKVYLHAALNDLGEKRTEIKDRCDFYMINFMPAFAAADDSQTLARTCGGSCKKFNKNKKHFCAYHANSAFDKNKDGRIQKYEVGLHLEKHFAPKQNKKVGFGELPAEDHIFDMITFNKHNKYSDLYATRKI